MDFYNLRGEDQNDLILCQGDHLSDLEMIAWYQKKCNIIHPGVIVFEGNISQEIDPNMRGDAFGKRSLDIASRYGHILMAEILINAGADVDLREDENPLGLKPPLYLASYTRHDEMVDFLIGAGAEIDSREPKIRMGLIWALKLGPEKTRELLEK